MKRPASIESRRLEIRQKLTEIFDWQWADEIDMTEVPGVYVAHPVKLASGDELLPVKLVYHTKEDEYDRPDDYLLVAHSKIWQHEPDFVEDISPAQLESAGQLCTHDLSRLDESSVAQRLAVIKQTIKGMQLRETD